MKIAITGGTGFVGKHLTERLIEQKHDVYILTRSPGKYKNSDAVKYVGWLTEGMQPEKALPHLDAIINLAGESLFGRWTEEKKKTIINSRIDSTDNVIRLIKRMDTLPEVLINASAIGFYGTSTNEIFTENTTEAGKDFLAHVTKEWESHAEQASTLGVRTVYVRFGMILGKDGTLPLMALPFKLMAGGKVGSGEQWMSWIHINDVVGIIISSLENKHAKGALNATAPKPKRNKEFSRTLAKALHRPNLLTAPSFAVKSVLGDMSLLVLQGQYVKPQYALDLGYEFEYPELKGALENLL